MLELYYFPDATCGIKARMALFEKGVEFEARVLDRYELNTPEYLALNPKAVVPTLVHDGNVLVESTIICLYVDDAFEGPSLRPAKALDRSEMYRWLKTIDEVYFKGIGGTTFGLLLRNRLLEKYPTEEAREDYYASVKIEEYRTRRRSILDGGLESPVVGEALQTMQAMVEDMESSLKRGPYLAGEHYSLADACATPFVMRLDVLGLHPLWDDCPRVADWWGRIQVRPSYQRLLSESFPPDYFVGIKEEIGDVWPDVKRLLSGPATSKP